MFPRSTGPRVHGSRGCTNHDVVAGPPLVGVVDDGMGDAHCGIANEGGSGKNGQPGKQQLLRVGDVVVLRLLHEIARGIGGG